MLGQDNNGFLRFTGILILDIGCYSAILSSLGDSAYQSSTREPAESFIKALAQLLSHMLLAVVVAPIGGVSAWGVFHLSKSLLTHAINTLSVRPGVFDAAWISSGTIATAALSYVLLPWLSSGTATTDIFKSFLKMITASTATSAIFVAGISAAGGVATLFHRFKGIQGQEAQHPHIN